MMTKIYLTDVQERTVTELAEWLFGGLISKPDEVEQRIICANALKLGLEQMRWEMEQSKAQEDGHDTDSA